jgi:E3 ubiquitin-protein ligase HUWE1
MQTGLFLEFEKSGGITAVVDVCTFCADLIDRFANVPEGTRTTRDKEVMAIALYFLRHPLIWFYHLASGKPLVESPQTLEILRFKTYEDFDPADTIVRLRLQLLPIFKRFWEAKWLVDTSESVRKAIIYGLLAILKGEHEDSTRLPNSHLSMPSHPAFVRRVPQQLSPAAIQQLTEMGFPETAVRSALTRARGDITVATELLLANAHLFDGTEDNTSSAAEGTSANAETSDAPNPETNSAAANGGATGSNDQTETEIPPPTNTSQQEIPEESEEKAPTPELKRDYAKELAEAREVLKASIVPNALRLADANPAFIDDIRDVFIGPTMNGNAKFLIEDIKSFSNGSNDVPEIPLQVRCRILALAYLKVGSKGLGLTKEDANELLQSLLALLLSGPVPGSATEPNIPKWLSSHMLLSDRILCSSEDIATVPIPQNGDTLGDTELYVGPKFTESRRVLFDFCMRLACIPDLQKDDLLSLFGVLSFLTKEHELAVEFVRRDGLNLVLQYFKNHRQQEDVAAVCMGIFRHIMEDQTTIRDIMRQDLKRWGSVPRTRPGEGVPNFLRAMQHTALRDPEVFLHLTEEMCELVEAHPSVGGHRIRPKAATSSSPSNNNGELPSISPTIDQPDSVVTSQDSSETQTSINVIHQLTAEMMQHYDPNAEHPGTLPITGLPNIPSSTSNSGMNTPAAVPEPGTNNVPIAEAPTAPFKDVPGYMSKEIEYSRFIQNVLTELLLCYEACKTAFLMYPRNKSGPAASKDTTKVKSPALSFILQESITAKGDINDLSRRRSKMNPFQSMVVALCSDVGLMVDALSASPSVAMVRKAVLEAITKALKDAPNTPETTEQRYGRFIALGDLCQKLLTTNPHAPTQKPQEESLFHISKLMLEKGFVSSLSAVLAEVDLVHPMASLVTSAILAPLETLYVDPFFSSSKSNNLFLVQRFRSR